MHEPVTGQVYAIYYPILAAIGIPVNILAIVILNRRNCGLSKCITHYLVSMAAADLMVVITCVVFNRIIDTYFPGNYMLLTPACRARTVLVYATRDISVWLTVAFTFDRFISICCQQLKTTYCTKKVAAAIVGTVFTLSCLKNIPWYFVYDSLYIFNKLPWYCLITPNFYISPFWLAYSYFDCIATPFLPFFIILLLNALTVRYILVASRVRRVLRGSAGSDNNPDPEMVNRRKSFILLFSISGNFLILWLTYTIHYLYYRITDTYSYTGYNDPVYILQETAYMLLLLSCCTNTFIYTVTQTQFRAELTKMVMYPVNQIVSFLTHLKSWIG
ncbi:probable G-protein coupled receptor 139 [Carcharodon carcharias]|uniref:probable G-protein coupled receptor 139 n=1 Tax=Carcharodon carcharias TaxID=13397 RepID=UPI001B7E0154|nr:probable G-protein coupled receptor 139 [Carcharodon carcharias]